MSAVLCLVRDHVVMVVMMVAHVVMVVVVPAVVARMARMVVVAVRGAVDVVLDVTAGRRRHMAHVTAAVGDFVRRAAGGLGHLMAGVGHRMGRGVPATSTAASAAKASVFLVRFPETAGREA